MVHGGRWYAFEGDEDSCGQEIIISGRPDARERKYKAIEQALWTGVHWPNNADMVESDMTNPASDADRQSTEQSH